MAKVATTALAFAASVAIAVAQSGSPTESLRIHGQVRVEGGGPIAEARVRTDAIRGPQAMQFTAVRHLTALSDPDGRFALIGVTRGLWILEITASGYLPHVVVVPIAMMVPPEPQPWETGLALLPIAAIAPADLPPDAPERLVLAAAAEATTGAPVVAVGHLRRLEGASLHAGSLVAAGDIALLVRDAARARRFFDLAAKAAPDWYRPHLGAASAAMLTFDVNTAIKAYGVARSYSRAPPLTGMLSLAIRDLQQISGKGR
jgi:hypothetical protein